MIEEKVPMDRYAWMKVAFFILLFLGAIMAAMDFTLEWGKPLYFSWHSTLLQSGYMALWPLTVAPLWWKVSFFTIGFLLLASHVFTNRNSRNSLK